MAEGVAGIVMGDRGKVAADGATAGVADDAAGALGGAILVAGSLTLTGIPRSFWTAAGAVEAGATACREVRKLTPADTALMANRAMKE